MKSPRFLLPAITLLLALGVSPVRGAENVHEARVLVNRVDDAIVSDANSPQVGGSSQLDASARPRIASQSLDTRDDPSRHADVQAFEFAPSGAREDNSVLSHAAAGDRGYDA
jgi:hypothetical protein